MSISLSPSTTPFSSSLCPWCEMQRYEQRALKISTTLRTSQVHSVLFFICSFKEFNVENPRPHLIWPGWMQRHANSSPIRLTVTGIRGLGVRNLESSWTSGTFLHPFRWCLSPSVKLFLQNGHRFRAFFLVRDLGFLGMMLSKTRTGVGPMRSAYNAYRHAVLTVIGLYLMIGTERWRERQCPVALLLLVRLICELTRQRGFLPESTGAATGCGGPGPLVRGCTSFPLGNHIANLDIARPHR